MELIWFCFPEYIGSESSFSSTTVPEENLECVAFEDLQKAELITLDQNVHKADDVPEKVSEEIGIVVGKYIMTFLHVIYDYLIFDIDGNIDPQFHSQQK